MVRIDVNTFVSDKFVDFNVEQTDKVLSSFFKGEFNSIKNISTFALFPLCGQNWNHYLLESYCYKYSKDFCLKVIHFNDKNSGIISKVSCDLKYDEMLAIVLSESDMEFSVENAGEYLFELGYLSKRKYAKLKDIVISAKKIREG